MTKSTNEKRFSLFHYNIKELSSKKIQSIQTNKQLLAVKEQISKHSFELLSINEIQFDLPSVPNQSFQTNGENFKSFLKFMKLQMNEHFGMANTGLNAKKNENGEYESEAKTPLQRSLADQVNFGVMPAQYSTALGSKFPIKRKLALTDIKLKDFAPGFDLTKFKMANGENFPEDMELFDKSFMVTTIDISGKDVHIVSLHTVPSFHFGNKKSINYERNKLQLEFLAWYLGIFEKEDNKLSIQRLEKDSHFVIVGDLNVDIKNDQPGAIVLKNIINHTNPWIDVKDMDYTHPSPKLMLDYILVSKNIKVIEGVIVKDASKLASDHLPIWGTFEIQ